MNPANARHGLDIDLDLHVFPVLQLARLAIALDDALREVNETRMIAPGLDASLKNLGLMTDIGQSIAVEADMAILSAIDLLKAYQVGPKYFAASKVKVGA